MEREYTDGTEPTVLPHLDQQHVKPVRICRGFGCYQGRKVCPHPEHCTLTAEACTDVGNEPTVGTELERVLVLVIVIVSAAAVIGFIGGLLT